MSEHERFRIFFKVNVFTAMKLLTFRLPYFFPELIVNNINDTCSDIVFEKFVQVVKIVSIWSKIVAFLHRKAHYETK